MDKEDWNHANELGDVKDTKYWFKRDYGTIKTALIKTVIISPLLLTISSLLSLAINFWGNTLTLNQFFITTIALTPISLLGYFLFYIMAKKGYNIYGDGGGTVIDDSQNPNLHLETPNKPAN
jgi:hypothetical protein